MIGQILAHYRVLEKIGQGGMGEVYEAADTNLNRQVAIKVLPEQLVADAKEDGATPEGSQTPRPIKSAQHLPNLRRYADSIDSQSHIDPSRNLLTTW